MKLVRIDGEYGFVEHDGKEFRVSLSLVDDPQIGDWLLAHGEIAVARVSEAEAEEIIALVTKTAKS